MWLSCKLIQKIILYLQVYHHSFGISLYLPLFLEYLLDSVFIPTISTGFKAVRVTEEKLVKAINTTSWCNLKLRFSHSQGPRSLPQAISWPIIAFSHQNQPAHLKTNISSIKTNSWRSKWSTTVLLFQIGGPQVRIQLPGAAHVTNIRRDAWNAIEWPSALFQLLRYCQRRGQVQTSLASRTRWRTFVPGLTDRTKLAGLWHIKPFLTCRTASCHRSSTFRSHAWTRTGVFIPGNFGNFPATRLNSMKRKSFVLTLMRINLRTLMGQARKTRLVSPSQGSSDVVLTTAKIKGNKWSISM